MNGENHYDTYVGYLQLGSLRNVRRIRLARNPRISLRRAAILAKKSLWSSLYSGTNILIRKEGNGI